MHAISKVNGSDFIAILQTCSVLRKEEDIVAYEQLTSAFYNNLTEYELFVSEVQEKMYKFDWFYDLSKPFDGVKTTVFRDGVHLTNEGNKIIADKISDIIDDYYKGKGYRNSCEET